MIRIPLAFPGPIRTLLLAVLLTHTNPAATVPFLTVLILQSAFQCRFLARRNIAFYTLPLRLSVSLTGMVVCWMLYRM